MPRAYRLEMARPLREVETVGKIVGALIGRAQRRQTECFFGEFQNAAEFVLYVRNVARFGVWRYDNQRHAKTQLERIVNLRRNMVVPATPIVPRDENRRIVPILTSPDRIDDRTNP